MQKILNKKEISEMNIDKLREAFFSAKSSLLEIELQRFNGQIKNYSSLRRSIKCSIARILFFIKTRERTEFIRKMLDILDKENDEYEDEDENDKIDNNVLIEQDQYNKKD